MRGDSTPSFEPNSGDSKPFPHKRLLDNFRNPAQLQRRERELLVAELYRQARTAPWHHERRKTLADEWATMCASVLPALRNRPPTLYTLRLLAQYGHSMVNTRPNLRHNRMPEDWRISIWLGRHESQTYGAVLSFSGEAQQAQQKAIQRLTGVVAYGEGTGDKIKDFKKKYFKPEHVRSIWVGQLIKNDLEASWEEPHIKVHNPGIWPEEELSLPVFNRLIDDLAQDPEYVGSNPLQYLENQYGTPEVFAEQREMMQRLGRWAVASFKGAFPLPPPEKEHLVIEGDTV